MKISKSRIVYFLLAAFTFIYFSYYTPLRVVNKAPFAFAIIAAILFTFFALQAIVNFKSWAEFSNRPSQAINWRHKISFFSIVPVTIMVFVFHFLFGENEKRELTDHGELATGTIIDGFGINTHRKATSGGIYELPLKFKTKQGETISLIESVSEDEFKNLSKGNQVELIYSVEDPNIIQLLLDRSSIKSFPFKGIEQRDIEVKDLQNMIGLPKDQLGLALNRINYKWTFQTTDSTWRNDVYDLSITSNYRDKIALTSFDLSPKDQDSEDPSSQFDNYIKQMEPLQLLPLSSYGAVRSYGNNQYKVSIEDTEKPLSDVGYTIGQKITVAKKRP